MFDQLNVDIDLVTEVFSQFGSVEVFALKRKCITPEMLNSAPKPRNGKPSSSWHHGQRHAPRGA